MILGRSEEKTWNVDMSVHNTHSTVKFYVINGQNTKNMEFTESQFWWWPTTASEKCKGFKISKAWNRFLPPPTTPNHLLVGVSHEEYFWLTVPRRGVLFCQRFKDIILTINGTHLLIDISISWQKIHLWAFQFDEFSVQCFFHVNSSDISISWLPYSTYLYLVFICSMTKLKEHSRKICYISTAKGSWNAADQT